MKKRTGNESGTFDVPRAKGTSKVFENLIKAAIKAGYTITYKDKL